MKSILKPAHWMILIVMVIASIVFRITDHPFNFTPVVAIALLAGCYINRTLLAWIMPVVILWLSDLYLNNGPYASYYDGFTWFTSDLFFSLIAMFFIVLIGKYLIHKVRMNRILIASLISPVIFFIISNLGAWYALTPIYSRDFNGLMQCYAAGMPFFRAAFIGDVLFTLVVFFIWQMVLSIVPLQSDHKVETQPSVAELGSISD